MLTKDRDSRSEKLSLRDIFRKNLLPRWQGFSQMIHTSGSFDDRVRH